jgi:mercuric ion transport protein
MRTGVTSLGSCIGSGLTVLCCLGTPAIIGFLSAIGVGFLVHDAILIPLLISFLGLNLWSIYRSTKQHGQKLIFSIATVSAILILSGIWFSGVAVGIGIIGLFISSGFNVYFSKNAIRFSRLKTHILS